MHDSPEMCLPPTETQVVLQALRTTSCLWESTGLWQRTARWDEETPSRLASRVPPVAGHVCQLLIWKKKKKRKETISHVSLNFSEMCAALVILRIKCSSNLNGKFLNKCVIWLEMVPPFFFIVQSVKLDTSHIFLFSPVLFWLPVNCCLRRCELLAGGENELWNTDWLVKHARYDL